MTRTRLRPRVLNRRTMLPEEIAGSVHVGRPTIWSNPHYIGFCRRCRRVHDRAQSIAMFRRYLLQKPELLARVRHELRGMNLICWCAPLPCHADVLLELANADVY